MFHRSLAGVLLVMLLCLLFVPPVLAGGWTVVTLQELPVQVQAGERITVTFLVQQHGRHPLQLSDGEVTIGAWQAAGDQVIQIEAKATNKPGYYAAEVIFPTDGVWQWEVRPGGFPPAAMPELTVASSDLPPTLPLQPTSDPWGRWQQLLLQLFSAVRRPAETGTVAPVDLRQDPVAYGKALFVAKGCVTCHVHGQVATQFSVEMGPNLSSYTVIPEYVSVWLRDPKAIKLATQMPQLPLQAAEIDALIAFLSQ